VAQRRRKGRALGRQETVKTAPTVLNCTDAGSGAEIRRRFDVWSGMSVLAYIALTVAIFTLLGFVQKWVQQL
jgi:hypothetical protein